MHAERIQDLSTDLYHEVFGMLDAEPDMDGMTAGRIANAVQDAFLHAAAQAECNVLHDA